MPKLAKQGSSDKKKFKVNSDKTMGNQAQLYIALGTANWFDLSKEKSVAM